MSPELQADSVSSIRLGRNPAMDAWLDHFLTENNLSYLLNPTLVATPEQLRFMVALEENQIYLPCSDAMFRLLLNEDFPEELKLSYRNVWIFVEALARESAVESYVRERVLAFLRHRFRIAEDEHILIPARLLKRLLSVVLSECGNPDPYSKVRREADQAAVDYLAGREVQKTLHCLPPDLAQGRGLDDLRWALDKIELMRLLKMSTWRRIWEGPAPDAEELAADFAAACPTAAALKQMLGPGSRKKILYLPDTCGGVIFDLAIVRSLLRQGHQVVMAFKEGFNFHVPTLWDFEKNPALSAAAEGAFFLHDEACSKNDLLRVLREHRLVIISDGTREQLNLCRVNVTFSRAWKECDIVIAKGKRNAEVLLGSSHLFTRDIISAYRTLEGEFVLRSNPRPPGCASTARVTLKPKPTALFEPCTKPSSRARASCFTAPLSAAFRGRQKPLWSWWTCLPGTCANVWTMCLCSTRPSTLRPAWTATTSCSCGRWCSAAGF